MKTLVIMSGGGELHWIEVIKPEEKDGMKADYAASPIGLFFFDIPEGEEDEIGMKLFDLGQKIMRQEPTGRTDAKEKD